MLFFFKEIKNKTKRFTKSGNEYSKPYLLKSWLIGKNGTGLQVTIAISDRIVTALVLFPALNLIQKIMVAMVVSDQPIQTRRSKNAINKPPKIPFALKSQ